jgi:hypothetical protein
LARAARRSGAELPLLYPGDPPSLLPFMPPCVCPSLATLLVSREFAALGVCAQRPGHIKGGGRWLTGEIKVLHTTEHLKDKLAPAVRSNTCYIEIECGRQPDQGREGR